MHTATRSRQRSAFVLRGSGTPGLSAQFDLVPVDPSDGRDAAVFTAVLMRSKRLGITRYEVVGIREGLEVFSMTAEPALGGRRLVSSRFRSAGTGVFCSERDSALARALIAAFFGKTMNYDRADAINALTFHLALGSGHRVESMSDVWFRCDGSYQTSATKIFGSLASLMVAALERKAPEQELVAVPAALRSAGEIQP